jgi:hypothetical protein
MSTVPYASCLLSEALHVFRPYRERQVLEPCAPLTDPSVGRFSSCGHKRSRASPSEQLLFPLWFPIQRHPGASTVTHRRADFSKMVVLGDAGCSWVQIVED